MTVGEQMIENAIRQVFASVGDSPDREGLIETPMRWSRAMHDMLDGYQMDPRKILAKTFETAEYDQMIVLSGIEFTSVCEHHLLPFTGRAAVAYIPDSQLGDSKKLRVVGISKLARLVVCFAHRLQIQERMTADIANSLQENLTPEGVGVVIQAVHSCMACRGIRISAEMTTSHLLGSFRSDPSVRAEFMALVNAGPGAR